MSCDSAEKPSIRFCARNKLIAKFGYGREIFTATMAKPED
jgi:hypothetical protein